ncbi:hypothetical protein CDAR_29281 [Caerostris darwini]|uniref:Uncharacterized protein n=1 Tax=Caerostris darwini TaxID=1538125 RepID=A0AAV4S0N9_9ARAC|nr:hypothetical protein CDAR_29281 [Caerostris darwini]
MLRSYKRMGIVNNSREPIINRFASVGRNPRSEGTVSHPPTRVGFSGISKGFLVHNLNTIFEQLSLAAITNNVVRFSLSNETFGAENYSLISFFGLDTA